MLVLTRRLGQRIVIGDNIVIEITDIRGDKVKLGINAPREVPVFREEVQGRRVVEEDQESNGDRSNKEKRI